MYYVCYLHTSNTDIRIVLGFVSLIVIKNNCVSSTIPFLSFKSLILKEDNKAILSKCYCLLPTKQLSENSFSKLQSTLTSRIDSTLNESSMLMPTNYRLCYVSAWKDNRLPQQWRNESMSVSSDGQMTAKVL